MRALVCVKRVIDYSVKVRINSTKTGVDTLNVKNSMNPFCEIAMEEAIRQKEAGKIKEIVALTIGPQKSSETLRNALALGADSGIHVLTPNQASVDFQVQPTTVAKIVSEILEKNSFDFVFCGKQSIDDDSNQFAQILSGLNWPKYSLSTFTSKLVINNDNINVEREVDSGIAKSTLPIPSIISTDLRLNEPRYATLPNLMKAKKKPVELINFEDLNINFDEIEYGRVDEPPKRKGGVILKSVDELIEKLKNEARVL